MDVPQHLAGSSQPVEVPEAESCPRCGTPWGHLPSVEVGALGTASIRRCIRCGARATTGTEKLRWAFNCNRCGLPFLDDEPLAQTEQRCLDCRGDEQPAAVTEPELAVATEAEFRAALAATWRFVGAPALTAYLDRLVQRVARRVPGAPDDPRVVVIQDWAVRRLGLPSGTVLLSVGALGFLEDEAELVFVLAHELAHAASGDAAERLARLGFQSVAREDSDPEVAAWVRAAEDLARMGYGWQREREADARAIEALLAMNYDPGSVLRYFERLQEGIEAGNVNLAELATSHPTPLERARRVESAVRAAGGAAAVLRVNREVYRRVAGRRLLEAELDRSELGQRSEHDADGSRLRRALRRLGWAALGVGTLALLILLVGWLLSR